MSCSRKLCLTNKPKMCIYYFKLTYYYITGTYMENSSKFQNDDEF